MTSIRPVDEEGDGWDLVEVNGIKICNFSHPPDVSKAIMDAMPNFKCRDDDVFICAPVKSGTHWTWEIISMLQNGKAETIPKNKTSAMLEFSTSEPMDALSSPRVLNSHLPIGLLPREIVEKKCKIVYVLRNLKDVTVSLYHHMSGIRLYNYSGKWKNFVVPFLSGEMEYGDWFDYVLEWERVMKEHPEYNIHQIFYEDLKQNPIKEIGRLAKFLGIPNTDNLYEAVADQCHFKSMKVNKVMKQELRERMYKGSYTMYRKGDVGDWKNWFTVAQNEYFDDIYNKRMASSTIKFRYTL